MHVTELAPAHIEACLTLWQSMRGVGLRPGDDNPAALTRFLLRNPDTCFMAVDNAGRLVGTLLCGCDGRRAYLYHVAVAEDCQHQGIGQAMVGALEDALSKQGIAKAALVAFSNNAGGNAFWEAMGYGRRDDLVYRDKWIRQQD